MIQVKHTYATKIQAAWRGARQRGAFLRMRQATIRLQAAERGRQAREHYLHLRQAAADDHCHAYRSDQSSSASVMLVAVVGSMIAYTSRYPLAHGASFICLCQLLYNSNGGALDSCWQLLLVIFSEIQQAQGMRSVKAGGNRPLGLVLSASL